MPSNHTRAVLRNTGLAALALLLGSATAVADSSSTVSLTAAPANALLPDGQQIPMWGYKCGSSPDKAKCSALNPNAGSGWSPIVITVPYDPTGTNLTINLTNNLAFPAGASTNVIPTSLVIVGQLGGGLGDAPQMTVSPTHPRAGATWPASGPPDASATGCDPTKAANATFCPPGQPDRVQSFGTEVAAGATTLLPTWSKLKPGTYLIESGTHPSIQGPMGLYGVLVVTSVADTSNPTASAYSGVTYDADVALLFSEIDPVQNAAVDAAVSTAGFSETKVWSGQPGHCGDPGAGSEFNTCYPPAVNYDPRYYLINGVSFDRTNPSASSIALLTPPTNEGGGGGEEEQTAAKVPGERGPADARARRGRSQSDSLRRRRQPAARRTQSAKRRVHGGR
jgi:FtsP/CotA-like multicopper oxidase with cupredoxin domain